VSRSLFVSFFAFSLADSSSPFFPSLQTRNPSPQERRLRIHSNPYLQQQQHHLSRSTRGSSPLFLFHVVLLRSTLFPPPQSQPNQGRLRLVVQRVLGWTELVSFRKRTLQHLRPRVHHSRPHLPLVGLVGRQTATQPQPALQLIGRRRSLLFSSQLQAISPYRDESRGNVRRVRSVDALHFEVSHFVSSLPLQTKLTLSFTHRHATVEAYRNQLWTRLAREAAFAKSNTNVNTNGADALASGLRPKFYTSPSSTASNNSNSNSFLNAKLLPSSSSQQHHSPSMSTPTPPPSLPTTATTSPTLNEDTSHLAFLAHVATQSITSRLSAAFVEAFTTPGPSFTSLGSTSTTATKSTQRSLDAEKIASVLSGRSVVQIVPVIAPTPTQAPTPSSSTESALERALAGLSLAPTPSPSPTTTNTTTITTNSCSVGGGLKTLLGCVGGARACHSGRPSSE